MVNFWFSLAIRLATFKDYEARFECEGVNAWVLNLLVEYERGVLAPKPNLQGPIWVRGSV